jgi:hypothetical protein
MSFLHGAHEMNAYRAAIGGYPKIVYLISKIGNTNMADTQTCEMGATLAPLNIGS